METTPLTMAQRIAAVASRSQQQRTGRTPTSVTVVFSDDTLVITLHEALTPAERALAQDPAGAAQVQEFHRQLFANSNGEMQEQIRQITGRAVREAVAEIEPATGAVVHAFTTGTMVQVFLLAPRAKTTKDEMASSEPRADDDGFRVMPSGAD